MKKHKPVLLKEVIEYLQPRANQNFVDCTYGSGGHTDEILKQSEPKGKVLAIDLNLKNITSAKSKVNRLILVKGNFRELQKIVVENDFKNIRGILLDLGVSSMQLDDEQQGFGFGAEKLDMRFDKEQELTAEKIVNQWPKEKLVQIFREFGQERLAKPIARAIEEVRKKEKITKPPQLVKIVSRVYRFFYKKPSKKNPATKVFLALRMAVNDELGNLEAVLPQAIEVLKPKGRLAVISYHSLEDKIVKDFFRRESKDCLCPPALPTCQCNHQATLKIITKKLVVPPEQEIRKNPRARSAKLRVAEKLSKVAED